MKLSFSSLGCVEKSLSETIELAARLGFDGVELRGANGTMNLWENEEFSPENLPRLRKHLSDAGIALTDVGTSVNFSQGTKESTRKALMEAQRFAEIAAELESPYIRIFGGRIPEGMVRAECEKWVAEGCAMLGDLMELYEVMPLLETHDDFSTGASVRRVLDMSGQKNLGVVWDILHPYRWGEAPEETWELLKGRVRHVHIKDANQFDRDGFDIAMVGEGRVPVNQMLQTLKENQYDGFLSLEWEKWWHPEIADGEAAFAAYMEFMKSWK